MKKVVITGPKSMLETVIKELYKLQVLHIVDHKKDEYFDIGRPLDSANSLSEVVIKLRSAALQLKINTTLDPDIKAFSRFIHKKGLVGYEKIGSASRVLLENVQGHLNKKAELVKENELLESYNRKLDIIAALNLPKDAFEELQSIQLISGSVNSAINDEDLKKISTRYQIWQSKLGSENIIAIAVEKNNVKAFSEKLSKFGFKDMDLKVEINKDFETTINDNLRKIKENNKTIETIDCELEELKATWQNFLIVGIKILSQQIEKAEAPLRMASTKNIFTVTGWVGDSEYDNIVKQLFEITNNKIHIQGEAPTDKDNPPVLLKNNRLTKPFQFLLDLYTLPKYNEFDPTLLIFLSFPVFYGFMLGDMGYGLTLMILFLILKKVMPAGKALFNILIISAMSSIFFGFLMGEFFGSEIVFGVHLHTFFSREAIMMGHHVGTLIPSTINAFLIISVLFGVLHLNLGLIMGFINIWKHHSFAHAYFEKISWIQLQIAAAIIAVAYAAPDMLSRFGIVDPVGKYIGYGLLLLTVYFIYKGEGIKGIIELPAIFSNILSYARLMALGLASVALAVVINTQFTKPFWEEGGVMMIVAVLVFIVGHAINIALGVLGPFLHSLRLTYVEFFSKFYEGGGERFDPFGKKDIIKT